MPIPLESLQRNTKRLLLPITAAFLLIVISLFLRYCPTQFTCKALSTNSFLMGAVIGIIAGVGSIFIAAHGARELLSPYRYAIKTRGFFVALTISLLVMFICIVIVLSIQEPGGNSLNTYLKMINDNPGGIFTIITGMATITGLVYTWQGLHELRRTIHSFADLIDRLCNMAKDATDVDPLKILAYTPAIGYLAQRPSDWDKFSYAMKRPSNGKPIVEMVCLREEDLITWHNLFIGRNTLRARPISSEHADAATKEATDLLNDISRHGSNNVKRLPFEFMPGYYLFFTRKRAIITAPLFLPFAKGVPHIEQSTLPSVQMIGLETEDRGIISDIEQIYEYHKNLPDSQLAESSCNISSETLAKPSDTAIAFTMLQERVIELLNNQREADYHDLKSKPETQIEVSLSARLKTW